MRGVAGAAAGAAGAEVGRGGGGGSTKGLALIWPDLKQFRALGF